MSIIKKSHILLCRPMGGLNDIFCGIQRCYEYAKNMNRILLIDTANTHFGDNLCNYFSINDSFCSDVYFYDKNQEKYLNKMTCYPPELFSRIETSAWPFDFKSDLTRHVKNKGLHKPFIYIDFKKDYEEQIVVSQSPGGGNGSFEGLQMFNLVPTLSNKIRHLLKTHGSNYVSVGVRNTDIKTDYRQLFEEVKLLNITDNILVCSDDLNVKLYAKTYFGNRVFFVTNTPDTKGIPLHCRNDVRSFYSGVFERNADALIDLCMLSLSKKIYFGSSSSGFIHLANFLNTNKPILNKFLNFS